MKVMKLVVVVVLFLLFFLLRKAKNLRPRNLQVLKDHHDFCSMRKLNF